MACVLPVSPLKKNKNVEDIIKMGIYVHQPLFRGFRLLNIIATFESTTGHILRSPRKGSAFPGLRSLIGNAASSLLLGSTCGQKGGNCQLKHFKVDFEQDR